MKSFKQYIGRIQLKEGGAAIKSSERINQENVAATLEKIYKEVLPALGVKKADTRSLGSTGKRLPGGSSGDVDLAISSASLLKASKGLTKADIFDYLMSKAKGLGYETKDLRSLGLISIGFPIENADGKQPDAIVQLDLMNTPNLEWAEFAFFSPHEKDSVWKGTHRNELFQAVVKYANYKTLKKAYDKQGVEVDAEWERDLLNLDVGVMKAIQSRIGKKGLTKNHKTISKEFKLDNPADVVKMYFGPSYKPKDIMAFDDMIKVVLSPKFIYKQHLDKILTYAAKGIVSKKLPLPKELEKYI